jgi:hypothetical protein
MRQRFSATGYRQVLAWAMAGLAVSALVSSGTQALSARSSANDRSALAVALDDQRDHNDLLQQQLDCRYVLGADVGRVQADVFVTVALALAAAGRADTPAVQLYTERLAQLADELERVSALRSDAVAICDTEPENVLG